VGYRRTGEDMTIAETVRQGQDTLARMGLGKERVDRKWDIAVTLQEVRLQYPKSLGEVCLEEADGWATKNRFMEERDGQRLPLGTRLVGIPWTDKAGRKFHVSLDDFLALRRALYHRERP
jgi:hypothetical protein